MVTNSKEEAIQVEEEEEDIGSEDEEDEEDIGDEDEEDLGDEGEEDLDDESNEDVDEEINEADQNNEDDAADEDIEEDEGGAVKSEKNALNESLLNDSKIAADSLPKDASASAAPEGMKKPAPKRKRSTNKISLEMLAEQIKKNQQKRIPEGNGPIKSTFDWIQYDGETTTTLNYADDFLKKSAGVSVDYVKLDLIEFEDASVEHHHSQVSSITDDLYKRILRYGQVESTARIAKKSGAIQKPEAQSNFRDELYYDQNDPFIDDDEYTNAPKGAFSQRMQLAEVFMDDFVSFDGDLKEFVNSHVYKNRVETMQNLEKKNAPIEEVAPVPKKRKKPQTTSAAQSAAIIAASQNPLSAAILSATATLNSKAATALNKKPLNELEKETSSNGITNIAVEAIPVITSTNALPSQDKKKQKKETAVVQQQSTVIPLNTNLTNSAQTSSSQTQNPQQNALSTNLLMSGDISAAANQAQMNQLLQQQIQQQQLQNVNATTAAAAAAALGLDFLKQPTSSYFIPSFMNQNMMLPSYFDTTTAQKLLMGSLDFNPLLMYQQQSQQQQAAQATNGLQNSYLYSSSGPLAATGGGSSSINQGSQQSNQFGGIADMYKNAENQKEKKKKKKPAAPAQKIQPFVSKLNKQTVDLIEIEDDDDPQKDATVPKSDN